MLIIKTDKQSFHLFLFFCRGRGEKRDVYVIGTRFRFRAEENNAHVQLQLGHRVLVYTVKMED